MTLTLVQDKWHINAGRITRESRDEMIKWCYDCWQRGWGEVDTTLGNSIFIFEQSQQAEWFMLRWS
jgi:hypothetical protein